MSRFEEIIHRKNTSSLKWDLLQERFGKHDILPMWVADMDFASPDEVTQAIMERAAHRVYGYTEVMDGLNEAIIEWNLKRNAWQIQKEWIVHTPGVVTSICNAIIGFTRERSKVLIQTPVYYPFYFCIRDNDRTLVKNPLVRDGDTYGMDLADLEQKLSEGVEMLILCSPHNPIGRVWKRQELEEVARLCLKYEVLLVSDEIHSDLVFGGHRHIPIATLSEELSLNSITLLSPTKTFNLAGLAHSVAIIPNAATRETFKKTIAKTGANMLNIFGLTAAQAAYTHGGPWVDELRGYLTANLKLLTNYFAEHIPQIQVIEPESTYLAWLDCRGLGIKAEELKDFFVHRAGVGLNDGAMFGVEGKGYQRLNFACPSATLLEGLRLIENAVKGL